MSACSGDVASAAGVQRMLGRLVDGVDQALRLDVELPPAPQTFRAGSPRALAAAPDPLASGPDEHETAAHVARSRAPRGERGLDVAPAIAGGRTAYRGARP